MAGDRWTLELADFLDSEHGRAAGARAQRSEVEALLRAAFQDLGSAPRELHAEQLVELLGTAFPARLPRGRDAAQSAEQRRTVPRLVVIEFPSLAEAKRFYDSPDYQEILPLRLRAAEGPVVLVEGV